MIVKNGIKYDYPFQESCLAALPMCDEFIFVEGQGDDGTYEAMLEIQKKHPKVKIIRHPWEKKHYSVLADLTNVAIEHCTCDYHFQIQADEAIHERYHGSIRACLERDFDYAYLGVLHFYGSYEKVLKAGVYYDRFIRLAKRSTYPTMRSCGDAMSLGCPDSDSALMKCADLDDLKVHHYGYVRTPKLLIAKQDEVVKWWGIQERDKLFEKGLERGQINWSDKFSDQQLDVYKGGHPHVLQAWIAQRRPLVENGSLQ